MYLFHHGAAICTLLLVLVIAILHVVSDYLCI